MAWQDGGVDIEVKMHHWFIVWIAAAMIGTVFWALSNGVWDWGP